MGDNSGEERSPFFAPSSSNSKNAVSSMPNNHQPISNPASHPTSHPTSTEPSGPSSPTQSNNAPTSHGDDFGMLGLLQIIRSTSSAINLAAVGIDLDSLHLALDAPAPVTLSWSSSLSHARREHHQLGTLYNVPPSLAANPHHKLPHFADDTLIYIFYTAVRDRLQEGAARELTERHWRYHKERQQWMTVPVDAERELRGRVVPATNRTFTVVFEIGLWSRQKRHVFIERDEEIEDRFIWWPVMDAATVKWDWVYKQLRTKRPNYSAPTTPTSVLMITWNVNGQRPPGNLQLLFLQQPSEQTVDVVGIGLQEVGGTVQRYSNDGNGAAEWRAALQEAMNGVYGAGAMEYLEGIRMSGLVLLVWCHRRLRGDTREGSSPHDPQMHAKAVSKGMAPCGLMGVMGGKGGVAVRLRLFDHWLTIVNCHLAAHQWNTPRRNQDYREIRTRLLLPNAYGMVMQSMAAGRALELMRESWGGPSDTQGTAIDDCDTVIWMGDLNYRLETSKTDIERWVADLRDDVDRADAALPLEKHDQLKIEQRLNRAFPDFDEASIHFPPTYKYDLGGSVFDTSEKARLPAYCDRILFRRGDQQLRCTDYTAVMDMISSDHKPVIARFTLSCFTIKRELFDAVYDDIVRSLDIWENALIPVTEVAVEGGGGTLAFGQVRFRRPSTRSFRLLNNGRTPAQFTVAFYPPNERRWLRVHPADGMLLPSTAADIVVNIRIADALGVATFTEDQESINKTIVVVRVVGGRDHFIPLEGSFRPTRFGQKLGLEEGPARVALVPIPLRRLAEWLVKNDGLRVDGVFLEAGDRFLVEQIIECIDDDRDFPEDCRFDSGLLAIGECLVHWLEALPEPVISPASIYEEGAHAVRGLLAVENLVTFEYIISLIKPIPRINRTVDRESLALVFGQALTRLSITKRSIVMEEQLVSFMLHFL